MKRIQNIGNIFTRQTRTWPVLMTVMVSLVLTISVSTGWAKNHTAPMDGEEGYEEEAPFDEAYIFFELNDTDGDLGIHAKIDGDAWKKLKIEDPRERTILNVTVRGRLGRQGLTELFFESAEPSFDELDPEDFFRRFPEGVYEVEGMTLEGEALESEVEISHVMPAPPRIYVNGEPIFSEDDPSYINCDNPLTEVSAPVIISWDPVTTSHPEIGTPGEDIYVHNYEVVVEIDEEPWVTSTILPPDTTSFEVPYEILDLSDEIKFEVLVRADNWNQTAIESCFELEE